MNASKSETRRILDDAWARRQKDNVRLAYVFGGIAFLLFLIALWKYRPL